MLMVRAHYVQTKTSTEGGKIQRVDASPSSRVLRNWRERTLIAHNEDTHLRAAKRIQSAPVNTAGRVRTVATPSFTPSPITWSKALEEPGMPVASTGCWSFLSGSFSL